MKKRLFSAFLVLCMVAALVVVPVQATEEIEQTQTTAQVGYCQHCKQQIPEEQWLPWDTTNTGPRTGHYYLANDIADQEKQITINLDDDLCRNKICLDLRGRSYTVTGLRPFLIYGIFSIMDSVGGAEIVVTGANNANGAFCQMGKKDGCIDGAGELNVYGGTIRRVSDDDYTVAYGGLIYIATGATLNVYGGQLIGGEVKPKLTSENKKVAPMAAPSTVPLPTLTSTVALSPAVSPRTAASLSMAVPPPTRQPAVTSTQKRAPSSPSTAVPWQMVTPRPTAVTSPSRILL